MKIERSICLVVFLAVLVGPQHFLPLDAAHAFPLQEEFGNQTSVAVGHETRQDDMPSITVAPDGSVWVAWLSFGNGRDDVALRRFKDGKWRNIHWVPNTSGDSWMPQVCIDADDGVWVVWSQQVRGNWDIYARRLDPKRHLWGPPQRLTNSPLPDIAPRVWSDQKGRAALVWQGFRGRTSQVFLRTLTGRDWSDAVRIGAAAANDWDPSVAMDSRGTVWVAYDSYRNGNYDVFLAQIESGRIRQELPVAATPRFEARATVAVDGMDRVWVAWESGPPNWGKDQGYVIRESEHGVRLGGERRPRLLCYQDGKWHSPSAPLASAFGNVNAYQPQVFSDGTGSVWVAVKLRKTGPPKPIFPPRPGYFEYWVTRVEGSQWAESFPLSHSKGRLSTLMDAAKAEGGPLWMVWPTDNRDEDYYHRPRRHQVHAAVVSAPADPPVLQLFEGEPAIEVREGHKDEPGDLRAIRAHRATINGGEHRIVRGDFHRHTELSWDEGGKNDGSLQDAFRYMIDAAAMDFGASTDHQGGAWPYWWWFSLKMTDMYHIKDSFAAVYGYERSASFPFGHRNMFFVDRSEARVSPFFLKAGAKVYDFPLNPEGDEPADESGDLVENDTELLYEEVRSSNGLIIPHTSGHSMFGTDWRANDPELEPVVEIFQGCRTSYEQEGAPYVATEADEARIWSRHKPIGMVANAWAKGYKLGIIASSDHFSTHISYAMVYTQDSSRQGILDAIRKRHTYGATDNIILEVRMGASFMGDEVRLEQFEPVRVIARGTGEISRVDIIKDSQVVYSVEPGQQNIDFKYNDMDFDQGRHYYYVRLQQQDGMIAWSSPLFVNY